MSPLRLLARAPCLTRRLSTSPALRAGMGWEGSDGKEHTTNKKDTLDVQSSSSKAGKEARAEDAHNSSATSEKDETNANARAQKEHPEAPLVIGMNDERGGVRISRPGALRFILRGTRLMMVLERALAFKVRLTGRGYLQL